MMDISNFKNPSADDKFKAAKMAGRIFFLKLTENIVGKGENAGNQHFLLFSQWF